MGYVIVSVGGSSESVMAEEVVREMDLNIIVVIHKTRSCGSGYAGSVCGGNGGKEQNKE